MASTLKVQNIAHTGGTTAMSINTTGGISTLKRPQVHLSSTKAAGTYTISGQDFSAGGSLQLLPNTTAIDFTFDVNGRMTPTHSGVYWIYGKIYLYSTASSGSATLFAMKDNTGSAPYGGTGTQIGNLESFEWDGYGGSGRIDKTLTGHHVEYIAAGTNVHLATTNTDYYLGSVYHACGMIKLD